MNTTLDLDEVTVLDLVHYLDEERHACSWPRCTTPAAWWFEHTCGAPTYTCEPHRERNDRAMRLNLEDWPERVHRCLACRGVVAAPVPWRPI